MLKTTFTVSLAISHEAKASTASLAVSEASLHSRVYCRCTSFCLFKDKSGTRHLGVSPLVLLHITDVSEKCRGPSVLM